MCEIISMLHLLDIRYGKEMIMDETLS